MKRYCHSLESLGRHWIVRWIVLISGWFLRGLIAFMVIRSANFTAFSSRYDLMVECWRYVPRERPTFRQIVHHLIPLASDQFREVHHPFLSISFEISIVSSPISLASYQHILPLACVHYRHHGSTITQLLTMHQILSRTTFQKVMECVPWL